MDHCFRILKRLHKVFLQMTGVQTASSEPNRGREWHLMAPNKMLARLTFSALRRRPKFYRCFRRQKGHVAAHFYCYIVSKINIPNILCSSRHDITPLIIGKYNHTVDAQHIKLWRLAIRVSRIEQLN